MQLREYVMDCYVIQLIQCNGKNIDLEFPKFGQECRNVQFGLATDGMNQFGNLSTNHNC